MNGYLPSKWQREYHACTADEMLGGGSAGPGKSLALLMDPCEQIVVEHARCQAGEINWGQSVGWALHMRRAFPMLYQSISRSKQLFTTLDPGAKYDAANHMWVFSSGYKFQFGHLAQADSYLNYRSAELTHLGIDEAGEVPAKDPYDELVLRVRSGDPVMRKMLKVRLVSNPWPNWVREYFVDPAPEGRKVIVSRARLDDGTYVERTRMFLPARLSDNPDPEFRSNYIANLANKPPHIRAALLDGDWYVVAGAYFADLWDPSRVVIKPFKIPPGWRRFRSGDWGYKSPCVILWWAISPDGEMICYRELTVNGPKARELLDAHGVAHRIREIEMVAGEWDRMRDRSRLTGPMDTNLWMEAGHRGPTMAHDMSKVGVNWYKASKGRRMCAQQLVKRLRQRGYNDRPGIMFFSECHGCISTIPAIGTDPEDPEVPLKGGPDHHLDATFYGCSANVLPTGKEDLDRAWDDDDDDRGRGGSSPAMGYIS